MAPHLLLHVLPWPAGVAARDCGHQSVLSPGGAPTLHHSVSQHLHARRPRSCFRFSASAPSLAAARRCLGLVAVSGTRCLHVSWRLFPTGPAAPDPGGFSLPRQLSLGGVPGLMPPLITPYRVLAAGRQDSGPRLGHGRSEDRTGLLPAAPPGLGSTTRKGAARSLCPWPVGTVLLGLHRMQVKEPDLGSPRTCQSAQWGSCPVQLTCHMPGQRVT